MTLEESLASGRGQRLNGRLWLPPSEPRGVLLAVHGLGSHSGTFQPLGERFTRLGWSVFALDLPGHGLSPGGRGRVDSFDGLLTDLAIARETLTRRWPRAPQALLGHSMGGNLAINYALRRRHLRPAVNDLFRLVLVAPMLMPPVPLPRPKIFAAWLTGRLFPWVRVSRSIDAESLTTDARQQSEIHSDELLHSRISLYLATQVLSQGRWAMDHARDLDVPTLVLFGQEDPLIDRQACKNLAIRIGEGAEVRTWPQMRHDLFRESRRDQVLDAIADWIV